MMMEAHTPAPVWQWLPGATTPTQVGQLSVLPGKRGTFQYDPAYLAAGGSALDPEQLQSVRRKEHHIPHDSREGIPGLIADAGPDSWGRRVLSLELGYEPGALEALCRSADDGAGNLAVGDLSTKLPVRNLDLQVLAEVIERHQSGLPVPDHSLLGLLSPDTALGGAKPKASYIDSDGHWIAKLTERGDPPDLPFYEAAALRMCQRLGIPAAKVKVYRLTDERSALLVQRFDRRVLADGGVVRIGMASALTVMGARAQTLSDARTYPAFAQRLKRWVPNIEPVRRELWQRLVFNALVGNNDDHPRNHAVLHDGTDWGLSPVFDVVPTWIPRERLSLSMPYLQISPRQPAPGQLTSLVSGENLIQAAPVFGWALEEAQIEIIRMAEQIQDEWAEALAELEAPVRVTARTQPVLDWAGRVVAEVRAVDLLKLLAVLKPRRDSWSWVP